MAELITIAVNTVTNALTVFQSFNFNSYCELNGKYYAAGPDGIFQIDVDQASVPFKMTTGMIDFGSAQQKRLSDFYIAMRSAGDVILRVTVDEQNTYEYVLSPYDIAELNQRRSLIGKGARGRYWQFELEGDADFDFDAYNVAVFNMSRRI